VWAVAACSVPFLGALAFDVADRFVPLELQPIAVSREIVDRNGVLLRPFATSQGRWRLDVELDEIDQQFIAMLVGYEDKRFYRHAGVDPVAMARAIWQAIRHGKIVSGGSTLTMQLARLIEPGQDRDFGYKLRQAFRAMQIERTLGKPEILRRYLVLAPYGGNIEGVRAASLAYFGKEPRKLLLSEAAMLVALPQSPEARRPDRHPQYARKARDRVLGQIAHQGVIERSEVLRARQAGMNARRRELPSLAAHLAEARHDRDPQPQMIALTIDAKIQRALETVAADAARRIGAGLSVAMILADSQTGELLAEVGSARYFDNSRAGWVDMTGVARSPGSTLKPFIYAQALDAGIVAPETLMSDRPTNFSGYRPRNFDLGYQGDVSVREALKLSLNVPAIQLLESVGAVRLHQLLRRMNMMPSLPADEEPGLAIGLGGIGLSLRDLVQGYSVLATGGLLIALHDEPRSAAETRSQRVLSESSARLTGEILADISAPLGVTARAIAYKTGTSYGYRDAWSIGFDGRYVLGVWVGRADNGAVPGITGGGTAAPILFEAFAKSALEPVPLKRAPRTGVNVTQDQLPVSLRRFTPSHAGLPSVGLRQTAPEIVFPPDGAMVELAALSGGQIAPLALKLQGGRAPFRLIANGKVAEQVSHRRNFNWQPDGTGFSRLTVIDAAGQAATVELVIK
jgi:penicillin-binding protein 1C